MKVVREGHAYYLEPFEEGGQDQLIEFIEKVPTEGDRTKLRTVVNGTTNEEVITMLIDRLKYLFRQLPSEETAMAIDKLEDALALLNRRTKNRVERGVEGTHVA